MTDDIVTRLREQYFTCECFGYGDCSRCESDKKAADEIERLRKDRDRWANFAFHVATCPNWGKRTCWDCVSPSNQDQARAAGIEKVIRDEYGK
jgi:hypothetical protein